MWFTHGAKRRESGDDFLKIAWFADLTICDDCDTNIDSFSALKRLAPFITKSVNFLNHFPNKCLRTKNTIFSPWRKSYGLRFKMR
ncbi:unnamed protein product, partial [Nesidiocoris tenuis]